MRIGASFRYKKARIEIIPLIDIMFFLLASFMLASLSLMRLQSMRMNLPTATVSRSQKEPDMVKMNVDALGSITIDKQPYSYVKIQELLAAKLKTNAVLPVYITGNGEATHGMIIHVLDLVRGSGVQNVSFAIATAPGAKQ